MYMKEKGHNKVKVDWQLLWSFVGHTEKIYSIKFHPLASGLLVSSSYDLTVRLWNLDSGDEVKRLTGHQDQVGEREPHLDQILEYTTKSVKCHRFRLFAQQFGRLDMDLNMYWFVYT